MGRPSGRPTTAFLLKRSQQKQTLARPDTLELTPVEQDLLGELARDDHGVAEVRSFVQLHRPELDDMGLRAHTCDLLLSWSDRGWLEIAPSPLGPAGLPTVAALRSALLLPEPRDDDRLERTWVRLAPAAYADVSWLPR